MKNERTEIYKVQNFIDESIVNEKILNKDFTVFVEYFDDDGVQVAVVVDGHHSLEAAIRVGAQIEIITVKLHGSISLVDYVTSFGELSNPVEIFTGKELW